jgi:hypothetical protein
MDDTLIIGFGHKTKRGKDTAVQHIIENRGGKFDVRRYAFADALKREANAMAESVGGMYALYNLLLLNRIEGAPPLIFADGRPVKYDPNPPMDDPLSPLGKQRELLQWWGTEFRRKRQPYYWIQKLAKTLDSEKPKIALISDMRFPNEAGWVEAKYGTTVKCDRIGYKDIGDVAVHESETALDSWVFNYEIQVMDGDIEELKRGALQVFDMITEQMSPPDISGEFIPKVVIEN